MSLLGVGPAELLLILIVALVVFGPERLPKMAKDLGKAMGKWRDALDQIQTVTDMPADKLIDLVAEEEEMQESVQEVVQRDASEEAKDSEEIPHEEEEAEEPEVEN
jgi:sec-independent protein translocase protein TatB